MATETLRCKFMEQEAEFPIRKVHTLIIGSGAAGLNAAIQLHANGIEDIQIVTEGLEMGTSINTGSDKQTYYKLGMCGGEDDSPRALAKTLYSGGTMHGPLALVEASLSARAFMGLVNIGVPFPRDRYGQFVGYKTDHDPRERATSVGPYTSREMCRLMIAEVQRRGINVIENRVAVGLLTGSAQGQKRTLGVITVKDSEEHQDKNDWPSAIELFAAENVIFAVGGPGGLYANSVYPAVHTGAIGLALQEGAASHNLNEAQFGISSTNFRWNVSGTYMQCIPRFVSTAMDGLTDQREFLLPYFTDQPMLHDLIFLKGYQWPFHTSKVVGGSSIIDLLVHIETTVKGRRVFLDFRQNPSKFDLKQLSTEAFQYLENSKALDDTPIGRLRAMNPAAVKLYQDNQIDIAHQPLEIKVCAQHCNGGLAGNIWWESENIKHLFPVGEVNGSHGITRPGGAALNSGQVGGYRAAEFIANVYGEWTLDIEEFKGAATARLGEISDLLSRANKTSALWQSDREEFQQRMTDAGGHIRSHGELERAVCEAWQQWQRMKSAGWRINSLRDLQEGMRNLQMCLAHVVYLESILFSVKEGFGSRGSALVLDEEGQLVHDQLTPELRFAPENKSFRDKILQTRLTQDGKVHNRLIPCQPIPDSDKWFETAWASYRNGEIYRMKED